MNEEYLSDHHKTAHNTGNSTADWRVRLLLLLQERLQRAILVVSSRSRRMSFVCAAQNVKRWMLTKKRRVRAGNIAIVGWRVIPTKDFLSPPPSTLRGSNGSSNNIFKKSVRRMIVHTMKPCLLYAAKEKSSERGGGGRVGAGKAQAQRPYLMFLQWMADAWFFAVPLPLPQPFLECV